MASDLCSAPPNSPLCLVAGVGPGIGAALVRKFASEGYTVLMLARSEPFLSQLSSTLLALSPPSYAFAFPTDLMSPSSLSSTFALIRSSFPSRPITVLLFNAAQRRLRAQPLESITTDEMQLQWSVNALSFHSLLREVIPDMRRAGGGTVLVTGATGGVRSSPGFGSFSASKWALRAMVGCLAKEVVGTRIHVAHVIVDAVVDTPLLRGYVDQQRAKESTAEQRRESASTIEAPVPRSGAAAIGSRRASSVVFAQPEHIADEYWRLHSQPDDVWSLEVDLRPYNEPITARL